jgi:CBS domain-containing protein
MTATRTGFVLVAATVPSLAPPPPGGIRGRTEPDADFPHAAAASSSTAEVDPDRKTKSRGEATEIGLLEAVRELGIDVATRRRESRRRKLYRFDPTLRLMSTVDQREDGALTVHALRASANTRIANHRPPRRPMAHLGGSLTGKGGIAMAATLEAAPPPASLEHLRVIDAMHPGVISCPLETTLRTVARMMATYRVHAIIVTGHGEDQLPDGNLWGVVTDRDLVAVAKTADLDDETAGRLAATPALLVATNEPLSRATQLMVEHEVSHLIVVEKRSQRPIGVLSTLDVARALAGVP